MQTAAVIDYIVNWLKDYANEAQMKGFVVGVSGGIDSAVVSALAAKTGLPTLVLEMPIHQKTDQIGRAQEHIKQLKARFDNVEEHWVDLTRTFDSFVMAVDIGDPKEHQTQLALANARSRIRMIALYYYAQERGLLVTGTGNKVEDFGVGFFTKYGDGGVDISPIADLLKTEVYELAKALDVPKSIQEAEPTDGLWDTDKTDEDQIGASYPELEWAMGVYDRHTAGDFNGREREVFEIYERHHKAMVHKINPIPVCTIPANLLK
ncbi:NAD(+) synthase [Snodgrassella sp. CFCC 13594]|uniref:NAD(+) synthase n=1 Tax=Snodgrassella sp. CFCC 13594 TaxID=1775559 RepID=UPI00082EE996|nr:NAD(+) synthase [Snodgrassella sp. CFCC 13594]